MPWCLVIDYQHTHVHLHTHGRDPVSRIYTLLIWRLSLSTISTRLLFRLLDLSPHSLFGLLCRFRLPLSHPLSYQLGDWDCIPFFSTVIVPLFPMDPHRQHIKVVTWWKTANHPSPQRQRLDTLDQYGDLLHSAKWSPHSPPLPG
jgi:hypothetical protein